MTQFMTSEEYRERMLKDRTFQRPSHGIAPVA